MVWSRRRLEEEDADIDDEAVRSWSGLWMAMLLSSCREPCREISEEKQCEMTPFAASESGWCQAAVRGSASLDGE